ncbi:hypothetical protein [Kiloniella sp. b19]|uniref:hypothetical protein n=1 Tax=Kiloniella sp. GXU_MW_B19 TaxID=3141326 RepID=UPI0031DD95EB
MSALARIEDHEYCSGFLPEAKALFIPMDEAEDSFIHYPGETENPVHEMQRNLQDHLHMQNSQDAFYSDQFDLNHALRQASSAPCAMSILVENSELLAAEEDFPEQGQRTEEEIQQEQDAFLGIGMLSYMMQFEAGEDWQ